MSMHQRFDVSYVSAADLDGLDDDTFKRVVDADIRKGARRAQVEVSQEVSAALRSPKHVDRWYSMLCQMRHSVETQLEAKVEAFELEEAERNVKRLKLERRLHEGFGPDSVIEDKLHALDVAGQEAKAEHLRKRSGTLKFRDGLDRSIFEAERLRGDHRDTRVRLLEGAINRHRAAVATDPTIEPSAADRTLWSALDE